MPQDVLIPLPPHEGRPTLWVPGTDHALHRHRDQGGRGAEGRGHHQGDDRPRKVPRTRLWAWKKEYGGRIVRQLRKLGVSCDWSRERFTMDEGLSRARARNLRAPLRKGSHLPRRAHHQLVPHLQDRPFGRGSGVCGAGFPPLAHPLSRRARRHRRGHHPPGKPCWAIPACASTPPTSATRTW